MSIRLFGTMETLKRVKRNREVMGAASPSRRKNHWPLIMTPHAHRLHHQPSVARQPPVKAPNAGDSSVEPKKQQQLESWGDTVFLRSW